MALCALLFDLDGTLIDTDELHLNAYNQLLARWGRSMDIGYYKAHVMGFPDDMIFSADMLQNGAKGIKMAGFFGNDWSVEKGEFVFGLNGKAGLNE